MTVSPSPFLQVTTPENVGLDQQRWSALLEYCEKLIESKTLPALGLQIQRQGLTTGVHLFGSKSLDQPNRLNEQTRFLIASLTKPMVAMAVMLLVERGQLALNQRVSDLLPEFKGANKRQITLKHILTHTSGLPDMLPNNRDLRQANASLDEFVRETCETDLFFSCGKNSQYQSMGFALLGPIIEHASGKPYQTFLQEEIFQPLGMQRAVLGLEEEDENIADVLLPPEQEAGDGWNWNSTYWKSFGAPWGGTLASVDDVSRFCRCMLSSGKTPSGETLFSPATIEMATTNRLNDFPELPEHIRRTRGWGYGWRMNWMDHRGSFGDLLGPEVFGHWGATGTLFWLDRKTETAVVLLSTQPYDRSVSPLVFVSNLICAAFE